MWKRHNILTTRDSFFISSAGKIERVRERFREAASLRVKTS